MAGDTMRLQVVTPEGITLEGVVIRALVVPSVSGYLGILPNHAPMVAALKPGIVRYKEGERMRAMATGSGFLEISQNQATLLVDTADAGEDIDIASARSAYQKLAGEMVKKYDPKTPPEQVEAYEVARARLRAAEMVAGGERGKH
jgi:F-type H+-transporting ATPase subunit epsilon